MGEDVVAKAKQYVDGLIARGKVLSLQVLDEIPAELASSLHNFDFANHVCPETCHQVYVPGTGWICFDAIKGR